MAVLRKWIGKLPSIPRGESPFLQRPLGLQTRITLLVTLIVVSVVALFSYLDVRLTERSQRELFRERTIYVARELDAKIFSLRDLDDPAYMEDEIAGWIYARPSIRSIDFFLFQKNSYMVVVSSAEEKDLGLTHQDLQALKRDLILSTFRSRGPHPHWEILAPLHVGRKIAGGIRIVTSMEEAENFLAEKRARAILFTLISVGILILILTFYFSRAINRPIQRLVRAMSAAEEGQLDVAVPITYKDELGLLADHFNRMLARISRFNEELTRRVETATRELAQRNEELRLANESLFQVQRQLVQAEKLSALGHVAATMAHEIGTPLNSISGYIQLILTEGTGSERMTRRLKIIESQLERLTQSVRHWLKSTRRPEPRLQAVQLKELLEETVSLTLPGLSRKDIHLVLQLEQGLPAVSGDPQLLQQVFLNLVTNALDAMPEGGTLTVSTRRGDAPLRRDPCLEVAVRDSGMGMSGEIRRKALEPFFTTKEPGKGAGLGLAICDEIVRSHEGTLEIESQEGKGSCVRLRLPVHSKEES